MLKKRSRNSGAAKPKITNDDVVKVVIDLMTQIGEVSLQVAALRVLLEKSGALPEGLVEQTVEILRQRTGAKLKASLQDILNEHALALLSKYEGTKQ